MPISQFPNQDALIEEACKLQKESVTAYDQGDLDEAVRLIDEANVTLDQALALDN